ncbi:hypothetical protein [Vibrio mediterranei]|uniref:Type I restriction endonuclease subunit M n=1 Tax=Vibrio mediterranei TaxID=689 RepID=A0ABX5D634_9VIBR|nr:hypothetical protein [Vibrio mediterranei]MCG9659933.1 type I restriction endonuclease subunit M [Vibrio mediterranei]PRQ65129.1 hypothetical protein COR51_23700 [Vibrio mediterranei]
MSASTLQPLPFSLGSLAITDSVFDLVTRCEDFVKPKVLLERHASGDWGEICQDDAEENTRATHEGGRIMSSYKFNEDHTVWVITEADRSRTTVLLPSDY